MTAAHDTSACRHFERWLTAYIDEELDAVHCLEVEDHLDDCADCREVIVHLRATRASLRGVMWVKAPSGLRERIAEQHEAPN